MQTRSILARRASAALALLALPWAAGCGGDSTLPQRSARGPAAVISNPADLESASCSPSLAWTRVSDGSSASASLVAGQKYRVRDITTCITNFRAQTGPVLIVSGGQQPTVQAKDASQTSATFIGEIGDATYPVSVTIAPANLFLTDHATVTAGSSTTLYFEAYEPTLQKIPSGDWPSQPVFTSDNPAIATVAAGGANGPGINVVVAGKSAGTTVIRTSFLGRNAVATITVNPAGPLAASVTLSVSRIVGSIGGTYQITATVKDAAGNFISKPVTWTSSNASVATVDQTGKITAKAAGTAVIRASVDGVSAEATIDVYQYACRDCSGPLIPPDPGLTY
ncbi:Ig-like domain-containing protein [Longimicrobium sp.]|uniref:Ig-like domain-containing protein n=1 Tax=Longimicrobium sp. TaxID=2029185 RepID=UPI002BBDB069|nr:Ig-like domain-containing protein [Longimicrobium sp.]HSU12454.1 Ig-like domain-containing protein [Longimicrobium sp.]